MSETHSSNRRHFLRNATLGGALALSLPEIVTAAMAPTATQKVSLQKGDVILFQGDSITDAGRDKEKMDANNDVALGRGYAFMAGSQLLYQAPELTLTIYNKGISGNKVYQLADRWDTDALNLKPTVLSILIGVNDFWHMINGNYDGDLDKYRNDYIALLERTKKALPNVRLIIGEPFAVPNVKAVTDQWYPEFPKYQEAARDIAKQFNATLIPYQDVFDQAQKQAPASYWTPDGVHPSVAGAQLMAHAWLKAVKA
ncbi:Lysophospholipase L1 [Catalinimonas alkaloidigena]|uniref:Lysophospholipase L1 n=1 Tax=Catalinimonas alkaloidigena TaxID=1075417 RepID=A0A1G9PCW6_9BACT|nr:SGNH/GDSL hydrolase family protein [Catalinimonas alkaloidigena]SDL95995.1 Lysophospholipase L1 [Catalinimonas alkaloidigena]